MKMGMQKLRALLTARKLRVCERCDYGCTADVDWLHPGPDQEKINGLQPKNDTSLKFVTI
jgi:hypothetical protein